MFLRLVRVLSSVTVLATTALVLVVPSASAATPVSPPKTNLLLKCVTLVCNSPQPIQPIIQWGPTQLISNGDFESGLSPWSKSGAAQYVVDPNLAHSGSGVIDFDPGGYPTSGAVTQRFSIPANAPEADFSFWLLTWQGPDALFADRRDWIDIDVLDTSGNLLAHIGWFSDLSPSSWTQMQYCSLSKFRGKTIQLRFQTNLVRQTPTVFFLDDVSVTVPNQIQISAPSCTR